MRKSDDILQEFGNRVRELRRQSGFSQEEFAMRCHLDRTYISSLERGHRNVSLKNIAAIAAALNVSLTELFEGITLCDAEQR
jgi:transcriptional regulator with XRE-family HTH domain